MEQINKIMIVGAKGMLGSALKKMILKETDWKMNLVMRDRIMLYEPKNNTKILNLSELDKKEQDNDTKYTLKTGKEVNVNTEKKGFSEDGLKNWKKIFNKIEKPDVIVNCAAITNVDECENKKKEAWNVNVDLPEVLIEIAKKYDIKYIQISSDYVFDGKKGDYTEKSHPDPINYYGRTKLATENLCIKSSINYCIVRTMWLYQSEYSDDGKLDFLNWVVKNACEKKELKIVTDEVGCPTFVDDLAFAIIKIIEKDYVGLINIAGDEKFSRYEIAKQIIDKFQYDCKIKKIKEKELNRKAKRPLNSGLININSKFHLNMNYTPLQSGIDMIFNNIKKKLTSKKLKYKTFDINLDD